MDMKANIAYDTIFSYTFSCEKIIKDNKDLKPSNLNALKFASYIPIISQIVWALILVGMNKVIKEDPNSINPEVVKVMRARAIISISPFGPLLLIADIFSTLFVKPFIACAYASHQKKINAAPM